MKLLRPAALLAAILFVLTAAVACTKSEVPAGMTEASPATGDFHLYVPKTWTVDLETGAVSAYYSKADPSSVNVMVWEVSVTDYTPEEWWESGLTDLESIYTDLTLAASNETLLGDVRAMQYEHGQSRVGKSLWDEGGLDLYIENSPVFHTENVTTPTLIMHNDNDGAVPWYQGIEFFMSLRRFGHPAWLLEYNNESHNLVERRNRKDLSIRLQQFFDHYLKGDPMPAWMKTGVPTTRKGEYFGFELTED